MELIILSSVLGTIAYRSGALWFIVLSFIGGILVAAMLRDIGIVGCIAGGGACLWLLCEFLVNTQIGGNALAVVGTIALCAAAGSVIGLIVLALTRLGKGKPAKQDNNTKE